MKNSKSNAINLFSEATDVDLFVTDISIIPIYSGAAAILSSKHACWSGHILSPDIGSNPNEVGRALAAANWLRFLSHDSKNILVFKHGLRLNRLNFYRGCTCPSAYPNGSLCIDLTAYIYTHLPLSLNLPRFLDSCRDPSLIGECNADCACTTAFYQPVCDGNLTYFSPCHAGCTDVELDKEVS